MALVSRSVRHGGTGRRWLLVGIVITLFVLLIDASLHSRSSGTNNQLAAEAWVDRATPIVTSSTAEGGQLAAIWSGGLRMPVPSLSAQLNQIASGAASAYRQAAALRPPDNLAAAAGLLDASLLARSHAAAAVRDSLGPVLLGRQSAGGPNGASAVAGIQAAGQALQVGDEAYRLFLLSLPKSGVTMPTSTWVESRSPYQAERAQVFVASLRSAMSSTAEHQVRIDSITTSPGSVSLRGNVQVLPDAPTMSVTAVLSDTGNQAENNLTVTAATTSALGNSSAQDSVSLAPGQSLTVQGVGPLSPPQGINVRLTVTVTPQPGSPTPPVSKTLVFLMPPTTPSTTTAR